MLKELISFKVPSIEISLILISLAVLSSRDTIMEAEHL